MRTLLGYAMLSIAAVAFVGCDSEQPANGGAAEAVLSIETSTTQVPRGELWEIWEDTDAPPDGIPNRQKREFQPNGAFLYRCQDPQLPPDEIIYPWGFSVEVSLVRAGSATPIVLSTTTLESQRFSAVTVAPTQIFAVLPDADNVPANEFYRNGKQVSQAHPEYQLFCRGSIVDPNIGPGLDNPAPIAMDKGDTIIVQARKATTQVNPVDIGVGVPVPVLKGIVRIGGLPVALSGQFESTDVEGDGLSFSFTLN